MFVLCLSVLDPPGVEPNPIFTSFAPFVDGACYWNSRSVRVGSISGLCLCRRARTPSGCKPTSIWSLEHQTLPGISRRIASYRPCFKCLQVLSSLSFGGRSTAKHAYAHFLVPFSHIYPDRIASAITSDGMESRPLTSGCATRKATGIRRKTEGQPVLARVRLQVPECCCSRDRSMDYPDDLVDDPVVPFPQCTM